MISVATVSVRQGDRRGHRLSCPDLKSVRRGMCTLCLERTPQSIELHDAGRPSIFNF